MNFRFWGVCIGATVLLRLGWLALFSPAPQSDFLDYYNLALSISQGDGYTIDGIPFAYRPVGYPAFLGGLMGIFGTSVWVGKIANLALAVGVVVLGHRVTLALFHSELAGRWTALLLALHPNQIAYTALLSAELLFLVLLLLGVWLLVQKPIHYHTPFKPSSSLNLFATFFRKKLRKKSRIPKPAAQSAPPSRWNPQGQPARTGHNAKTKKGTVLRGRKHFLLQMLLTGVVFGLATYVKPQATWVPVVCLLMAFWRLEKKEFLPKIMVPGIVLYLGWALVLAPWWVRNYQAFDGFVMVSTNGGTNFFIGNNPLATGKYRWDSDVQKLTAPYLDASINPREVDQALRKAGRSYVRENPLKTVALFPKKLWYTYGRDTEGFDWVREGMGGLTGSWHLIMRIFKGLGALFYGGLWLLFLWAIWKFYRYPKSGYSPFVHAGWGIILYMTLIYLGFFGDPRFHFPVLPWMMVYVSVALAANHRLASDEGIL